MNNSILPWQSPPWQSLWEAQQKNRLPHALLFVGPCHLEKKLFADELSAMILCGESAIQDKACGKCHTCHLVRAKSHPDLIYVEPEQTGQMIKIDQIRAVVHFVNGTPMQSKFRIIMINPAHAMNLSAANALLKTLEEPTPNTLLILITDQNLRLPATITSRCQKIIFQKPPRNIAVAWLETQLKSSPTPEEKLDLLLNLAEGSPLKAVELITNGMMILRQEIYQGLSALSQGHADPVQLAAQWQDQDVLTIFKLLLSWLRDMLRFELTQGQATLINNDYQTIFANLIQKISRAKLLHYLDTVQQIYAKLINLQNLNRQLLLEELFIRWVYVSR